MYPFHLPASFYLLAAFGFGLIVGSFLNVCIYRLPRKEALSFPASHCPKCQTPLRFYDNIPLLSYLLLKGKCRYCQAPIAYQYPLVELLTGLLFMLTLIRFGLSWSSFFYALFLAALIVIIFIDAEHMLIPDKITLPGIGIGFSASLLSLIPLAWDQSLLGLLVGGGLLYLAAVLSKGGMGGGDIKLAAMMGVLLGWRKVLLAIMAGASLGSIIGIGLILTGRKTRKDYIPFGPFLAWGGMIGLFWGNQIIRWYRTIFW